MNKYLEKIAGLSSILRNVGKRVAHEAREFGRDLGGRNLERAEMEAGLHRGFTHSQDAAQHVHNKKVGDYRVGSPHAIRESENFKRSKSDAHNVRGDMEYAAGIDRRPGKSATSEKDVVRARQAMNYARATAGGIGTLGVGGAYLAGVNHATPKKKTLKATDI